MNSFGKIKSKIEKLLEKSYGTDNFKTYLKGFKKNVLNKKNISEMYFLYDELSSNKGLNESMFEPENELDLLQFLSNQVNLYKTKKNYSKKTEDFSPSTKVKSNEK